MMLLESIDLSYKCELRVMFALIMCVNECALFTCIGIPRDLQHTKSLRMCFNDSLFIDNKKAGICQLKIVSPNQYELKTFLNCHTKRSWLSHIRI
jgi:hypothetical protein